MRPINRRLTAGSAAAALALVGLATPAAAAPEGPAVPTAGDETIVVPLNDSAAGGTYLQAFERAYAGATPEGTPVYVYVPEGALAGPAGVDSLDPAFDHAPGDGFVPCGEGVEDYRITQEQVDFLGDELAGQIVAVDEAHFGEVGDAAGEGSDALVTLVYNVQDEQYYDCTVTSYTAGYFAPDFIDSLGMNVIVLDAFDWANRIGADPSAAPWSDGDAGNDSPELYEGVIAHELEHLLMNYSDPGELSWVDEGLADMAAFLNGYDMTGSHLTYQQVFHRETSLTRWGGGLENYGASFSYFAYLWEQAGGNGAGDLTPDLTDDGTAGDLLIELVFAEQADGMAGVQRAIDAFNRQTGAQLRSAEDLFRDWAVTMYADAEGAPRFDLANFDLGPASGGYTVDIANDEFWDERGDYQGAQPQSKWQRQENRPDGTALPFGVSYETFRNPGPRVAVDFTGAPTSGVLPHTGDEHWWGGYASQSDTVLDVDTPVTGGTTLSFWNWHLIEDGWDYGFVEALVGGEWVAVPVTDASGAVVTRTDDPHGNNTEGNGITGTSGGTYLVDEPEYVQYSATLPAGATDVRFRYSTDAAYLDTGWFIDDVTVDGAAATVTPAGFVSTDGVQDNDWTVQVIAGCDLTPGRTTAGEVVSGDTYVYRSTGDDLTTTTLDTKCANGSGRDLTVSVSNLPTGDLAVLDATYDFSVVKQR